VLRISIVRWGIPEPEGLRAMIEFVSEAWFEVVRSATKSIFIAGTSVQKVRSVMGAMRYVSGYASKNDQTSPGKKVGRYWGVVGNKNIPGASRSDRAESGAVQVYAAHGSSLHSGGESTDSDSASGKADRIETVGAHLVRRLV